MEECNDKFPKSKEGMRLPKKSEDLNSLSFRHPMRGNIKWMLDKLEEADPGGKRAWAIAQEIHKENN